MSEVTMDEDVDTLQEVVSIVSAYVSHNAMRAAELPEFIGAVHAAIRQLSKDQGASESKPANVPAVPIKRSITKDFIICLEDGKKFKSLRRHLSSCYNMTPDEYRAKWGLPSDYPMVAPAYSATRSQLARESGLGQISRGAEAGRRSEDAIAEVAEEEAGTSAPTPIEAAAEGDARDSGDGGRAEAEVVETAAEPPVEAPKKAKRGRPKKVAA